MFNLHCELGTQGHNLYGKINQFEKLNNSNIKVIKKETYMLDSKTLEEIVNTYDTIYVFGVVTDICVFQNVIGLYNFIDHQKNVEIIVDSSCCASFDPEREKMSLNYMNDVLGVKIV
jgi:nicotinamidase-related amidase